MAGVLAGLVGGCSPATVDSIRDADYDRPVETLYMVSAIGEKLDVVESTWLQSLSTGLQEAQIRYETDRLDFDVPDSDVPSLEETSVEIPFASARDAGATQVLVVEHLGKDTQKMSTMGPSPARYRVQQFDVSVFDAETEERVWRATIQTPDGFGDSDRDKGLNLARKIANTLVADGLLPEVVAEEVPRV